MESIPLLLLNGDGTTVPVIPPNAIGCYTEDCRRIVGWDFHEQHFFLDDGSTRMHGEINFNSFLKARKEPLQTIPDQDLYEKFYNDRATRIYAHCKHLGDCRVENFHEAGTVVRGATSVAIMDPMAIEFRAFPGVVRIATVTLLCSGDDAFVFHNVTSFGGAMGLVAHLMGRLGHDYGMAAFYRHADGEVHPLTSVETCRHLVIEVRGDVGSARRCADTKIVHTNWATAEAHHDAMRYLDNHPWAMPCSLETVLYRIGRDPREARMDLVSVPYVADGVDKPLDIQEEPPNCTHSTSMPADVLVDAVRSGKVRAYAGGIYVASDAGAVRCPVDLHAAMNQLEQLLDDCWVLGCHPVRLALQGCPEKLIAERFGEGYDKATGRYTSTAVASDGSMLEGMTFH